AILTGTLLKSAGLPTRLASGLVNWDGTFYYHAWDEVWNGRHWIGIDSTTPEHQISAAHVKLASGTVAQAFTFAVLDNVDIQILASRNQ
ncbi:MAG TPA: transglutaminase domain-containing protein, partial [Fimbriimonas sp.]|nr:transglutaminase domain-containing protein [Fimbriimonas sp.]